MTIVLTTIPIPIENPTNPLRYSLLIGWKKVLKRRDIEKNLKKALLISMKERRILRGASPNQNDRK